MDEFYATWNTLGTLNVLDQFASAWCRSQKGTQLTIFRSQSSTTNAFTIIVCMHFRLIASVSWIDIFVNLDDADEEIGYNKIGK